MKASVYTSLFNYSPDKFDLLGAFKNWSKYADEIVIATFEDQAKDISAIVASEMCGFWDTPYFNVVSCPDTSLDDPLFDGKLKNAALQECSNELVIQQDLDERLGGSIEQWEIVGRTLMKNPAPLACMLPTIDLYKDLKHYKGINRKWFFHLKEKSFRGPVNFAKRDGGLISIKESDSCELIDENGDLVPYFIQDRFVSYPFSTSQNPSFDISKVHSIHLGYLDLDKRIENNKFWEPIWSSRCGEEVQTATTLEQLEKENEAKPHGLPEKWWE